jgi:hypothetical protein
MRSTRLRRAMLPQRHTGATLGDMQPHSHLLNAGTATCKVPCSRSDEERRTADIVELARQYGRYGYRKIAGLLRQAGWTVNGKRGA